MALVCCSLVAPWYVELRGLQCSLVDHDPGAILSPSIAHDLELSCDGLQLARGSVANFYCELFHKLANIAFGNTTIGLSLF